MMLALAVSPSRHLNQSSQGSISGTSIFGISPSRHLNQRGSGTALMMAIILILAMMSFLTACLLAWFGGLHRSRAIADLAALAGAEAHSGGYPACAIAQQAATANGATLTACQVHSNGYDFLVRVTVCLPASPQLIFGPRQFSHSSEAGNL